VLQGLAPRAVALHAGALLVGERRAEEVETAFPHVACRQAALLRMVGFRFAVQQSEAFRLVVLQGLAPQAVGLHAGALPVGERRSEEVAAALPHVACPQVALLRTVGFRFAVQQSEVFRLVVLQGLVPQAVGLHAGALLVGERRSEEVAAAFPHVACRQAALLRMVGFQFAVQQSEVFRLVVLQGFVPPVVAAWSVVLQVAARPVAVFQEMVLPAAGGGQWYQAQQDIFAARRKNQSCKSWSRP
jgi:hypothetical protein